MTIILEGGRHLRLSRMSLPFLVGTMFTGNRRRAELVGSVLYLFGGWMFASCYFVLFNRLGEDGPIIGAAVGLVHGLFLLMAALPVAPSLHPRMASPYDGPDSNKRIEPPGFLGLNYSRSTPALTLVGQAVYGLILGIGHAR